MEKTHHRDGRLSLLRYNVVKGPDLSNPLDPSSKPTGNTCFVLSEVYETPDGLADHWKQSSTWKDFNAFIKWAGSVKGQCSGPTLAVQVNGTVTLGANIIIVPYVIDGGQQMAVRNIAYLVFLVDPQGIVRFSYPPGDIPINYVSDYPALTDNEQAAADKGTLAYTHQIPTDLTSVGTWTVVVFTIDYYPNLGYPPEPLRGGVKANFVVVKPTTLPERSPMLGIFVAIKDFMLAYVGPVFFVWGLLSVAEVRKSLMLLFKNRQFIIGFVILTVTFLLGYLVR